jgi:SAM-dependent methyltransferase
VSVVGDVERLPLRDSSVDVAYVHDGLHHLDEPMHGVREMMRVARGALSINEPADAAATSAAVRFGLALTKEHAGNRVARIDAEPVLRELRAGGFEPESDRYFMFYRHEPGVLLRAMSYPGTLAAFRAGMRAADALLGRFGNKLNITAVRYEPGAQLRRAA